MFLNKQLSVKEKFARNFLIIPLSGLCLIITILMIVSGVDTLYWFWGALWAIVLMAGFGLMAYLNWLPNTPNEKEFRSGKFCEQFETQSRIVQPINTWTNLGFIVSGLTILLIAGHQPHLTLPLLQMSDPTSLVPLFYAVVVIFLGPGSMLFHASGKKWAGWFDTFSMVCWVAYCFSYTATRWIPFLHLPETLFGVPIFGLMAGVITFGLGAFSAAQGLWAFKQGKERNVDGLGPIKVLGTLWLLTELVTMVFIWTGHPPGFRRSSSWLFAAILAYIAAFVCWIPSTGELKILKKTIPHIEKLWCNPESPYQGHGFWHLFAAFGSLCIYLHYASESPI